MSFARDVVDAADPSRPALVAIARDGQRSEISFGEVADRSARLAGGIESHAGLPHPGDQGPGAPRKGNGGMAGAGARLQHQAGEATDVNGTNFDGKISSTDIRRRRMNLAKV